MKTKSEIESLASELSEAEIASILWAKSSKKIKGHAITSFSLDVTDHFGAGKIVHGVTMHCAGKCVVCEPTMASAEQRLWLEMPNSADEEADQLRAEAKALLEKADKLTGVTYA